MSAREPAGTFLHPAVDIVTDQVAVVLQDRPVVPLTAWLVDAAAACAKAGQGLQVVTPADARITLPLRMTLSGPNCRWVVREPGDTGFFDGLSGVPLAWTGSAFAMVPEQAKTGPSPTFAHPEPNLTSHLVLDVKVLHPAALDLVLGGGIETLARILRDGEPAGWGIAEPLLDPWNRARLTDLCHRRSPKSTWLLFAGPGFIGSLLVSRVTSGVKEEITFLAGYPPGAQPPLDRLEELAATFADEGGLLTMTAQRSQGRMDLSFPARWCGAPTPVGFAIGPTGVRDIGLGHALSAPVTGRTLGRERAPTVWYDLADRPPDDAWTTLNDLMKHLRLQGPDPDQS